MPSFVLTIRVRSGRLEAQATGQGAFRLDHSRNDRFFASGFGVEIQFNRNPEGQAESLTFTKGDKQRSGKRKRVFLMPLEA